MGSSDVGDQFLNFYFLILTFDLSLHPRNKVHSRTVNEDFS